MAHEEPPLHAVFAGCGTTLSINHTGLALACASIVALDDLPHSTTSATNSTRRCDFSKAKGPSSGFRSTSAAVERAHDSVAAAWARNRSMPKLPATPLMLCACVLMAVSQPPSIAEACCTALAALSHELDGEVHVLVADLEEIPDVTYGSFGLLLW